MCALIVEIYQAELSIKTVTAVYCLVKNIKRTSQLNMCVFWLMTTNIAHTFIIGTFPIHLL